METETGVLGDPDPSSGERWIEVTNRRIAGSDTASTAVEPWTPIDGTEQVILGDLSILADGGSVKVATPSDAAKAAGKLRASKR